MNQLADAVAASPDPNNNNSSSARSSSGGRRRRRWGVGRRGESPEQYSESLLVDNKKDRLMRPVFLV